MSSDKNLHGDGSLAELVEIIQSLFFSSRSASQAVNIEVDDIENPDYRGRYVYKRRTTLESYGFGFLTPTGAFSWEPSADVTNGLAVLTRGNPSAVKVFEHPSEGNEHYRFRAVTNDHGDFSVEILDCFNYIPYEPVVRLTFTSARS